MPVPWLGVRSGLVITVENIGINSHEAHSTNIIITFYEKVRYMAVCNSVDNLNVELDILKTGI